MELQFTQRLDRQRKWIRAIKIIAITHSVTNLIFGEDEKPFHSLIAHGDLEGIKKALAKNPSILNLPTENMMNGQVVSYPMFDALYWFIIYDQQRNEHDNAEKQRDVFYYLSPTST